MPYALSQFLRADDWHNLGLASGESQELKQTLRNAQRDNYYESLRLALIAQLAVWMGVIRMFYVLGYDPFELRLIALLVLATLIHQATELFFQSFGQKSKVASGADITRILATAISASGAYGVSLASLYNSLNVEAQTISCILAAGFCTGAIGGMGYIPAAAISYISLILGPMIFVTYSSETIFGQTLSLSAAMFFLVLIGFISQIFRAFKRAVNLGVVNLELLHKAEAGSRAKSEFLAAMSHELRTPLNAISNYSTLVREELLEKGDTTAAIDLERIQTANRHLLALIGNALDLAKIEAGKLDLEPTEFSLDQLIEEVVAIVSPLAASNSNRFSVSSSGSLGIIQCDPLRLRQVLINLLGNACKFTKNGVIELVVSGDADRIEFTVIDTGIGMSAETLASLFQAYQQADKSITRRFGGSGLGLMLSDVIVKAMGGRLTVTSQPGQGSSFSVLINRYSKLKDKIAEN